MWALSFVVLVSSDFEIFCFFAENVLDEDHFFPAKANFDFTELMKSVILILCPGGNTNFLCIDVVAEVSLLACTVGGKQESSSE